MVYEVMAYWKGIEKRGRMIRKRGARGEFWKVPSQHGWELEWNR